MIGRKARPCTNLFGMYRRFGVVPQGLDVLFLFVLFGEFRSLPLNFMVYPDRSMLEACCRMSRKPHYRLARLQ
jgi:hypothetical protein